MTTLQEPSRHARHARAEVTRDHYDTASWFEGIKPMLFIALIAALPVGLGIWSWATILTS